MNSDAGKSARRVLDETQHQQNDLSRPDRLEHKQEQNTHWGPTDGPAHQTSAGAAQEEWSHVTGRDEEPQFSGNHTVPASATTQPVSSDANGIGNGPQLVNTRKGLQVLCGPLLNYRRMSKQETDTPIWHGSVLIVATAGQQPPLLRLQHADDGDGSSVTSIQAEKLYEDPKSSFWRFEINVPFLHHESRWEYHIPGIEYVDPKKTMSTGPKVFSVPSKFASMRIMFHSCNGFSVGTDTDAWSGCALWNDVLRNHEKIPFHVMIGGGDQIYNDGVRVDGPLRPWTDMASPHKRRNFPFNEELRAACDEYYFNNYVRWYGIEPFAFANCQIPQLNIWDDHDIIDGFGSYTDHFMQCAVFRGIGGVAHKYYLLFQHHLPPPVSTFTTDAPQTLHANAQGTSDADAVQLKDTYVMKTEHEDPSYIIGTSPGPYVEERSRSIYCQLGARVAFLGIDARTERTRHQINYPETYDQVFSRTSKELAANPNLKHLILLLGVPIAYPRLQWLENILQSPIIGPIRFLNKRFGLGGGFFNHFDGNVDLLDDLDDHYTAHQHKKERRDLVHRLQRLAKKHNVRVSILGGDVHLAALGRFYSNPKLGIPVEKDWRYMPNIISSAITNKPPPSVVANLLAKRNKIHHLDTETDETLLTLFDRDPGHGKDGVTSKTADSNHCTMPSRNYAIISESHDLTNSPSLERVANGNGVAHDLNNNSTSLRPPPTANGSISTAGHSANGATIASSDPSSRPSTTGTAEDGTSRPATAAATDNKGGAAPKINPRNALHAGEEQAGTQHPAASGLSKTELGGEFGLDVSFRVEISPSDREGHTEGYGLTIPALSAERFSKSAAK
ncbi:hypothetical protein AAFC00_005613 [Neodothiora populina]|uniref:PhoD-like phosphatase domain-containing protein n=1 Tax=Neodothiora populina TaxID=2781224 RepID=A0ABR3PLR9_9PEZI